MKFGVPVVSTLSGIGVMTIGIIMPIYIDAIKPYSDQILIFGLMLTFCPWLLLWLFSSKTKKGKTYKADNSSGLSIGQKINEQTCEWIQKYGVWRHKKTGLYYCPRCAPWPSPLSTDNDKRQYG